MQNDSTRGQDPGLWDRTIFRTVPIPVPAFDHLKNYQRAIQATGKSITFNEVLARVVMEHQQQNAVNGTRKHEQTIARPRA
jgi:hypothetical protein